MSTKSRQHERSFKWSFYIGSTLDPPALSTLRLRRIGRVVCDYWMGFDFSVRECR